MASATGRRKSDEKIWGTSCTPVLASRLVATPTTPPEALSAGPPLLPLSIWPSVRMKFRYPPSEPKLNTLPGVTVKSPPGAGYPSVTMRSPSATVAVGAQSRYTSNSPSTSMTATSGC